MEAEAAGEIMTHLTTGGVIVYGIEALKKAGWCPFISADSKGINRFISGAMAAFVAFGISASGDASAGWVIQIPPLAVVGAGAWEWLKQVVLQQMIFDGVVAKGKTS